MATRTGSKSAFGLNVKKGRKEIGEWDDDDDDDDDDNSDDDDDDDDPGNNSDDNDDDDVELTELLHSLKN